MITNEIIGSVQGNDAMRGLEDLGFTCVDGYEGCLLDNYVYESERGDILIIFYEQYANCWSSVYHMVMATGNEDIQKVFNEFLDIQAKVESESND